MLKVALGVFSLGVGLAIGVPVLQKSVQQAQAVAIEEDLREFAEVFQAYARQRGSWPPAAQSAGRIPSGLENKLGVNWSLPTPIGLRYFWAPDALQRGVRHRATILLWRDNRGLVATEREVLEEVDRRIDDGDLRSGKFQLGYRDQPFLVIEP